MIPVRKRVMGVKTDLFVAHSEEAQSGNVIKGVPASAERLPPRRASCTGRRTSTRCALARCWWREPPRRHGRRSSPCISVVTDIGGPLSHGSIVAREYGIPAVMGTGVATRRIHSGQIVTVDGSAGTVMLGNGRN